MTDARGDAALIARLNDLLQLDHDAVNAYTVAIDLARDKALRDELVRIRAEHKERIEQLASMVRQRGGLPVELPHITVPLKVAVQAAGAVAGDSSLLLAFKAVERQVRDKFIEYSRQSHPADVASFLEEAAKAESEHYGWCERQLKEMGVTARTLPYDAASALEQIHKLLANPVERMEREIKQRVGEMVGTRHSRGGSDAPSPAAAASGVANTMEANGDSMSEMMNDTKPANERSSQRGDVEQFIEALHELEESRNVDRIVSLFDSSAEITNAIEKTPRRGTDGAREFWRVYRESFAEIHSDFKTVVEQDGKAVLEWTSHGRKPNGDEITYSGVSVLELNDGKVRSFRAYFDPGALTAPSNRE